MLAAFWSIISLRAKNPNNGMVISATTKMDSTARNLVYIGKYLANNSVSHMKLEPQESNIEKRVATNNAHL